MPKSDKAWEELITKFIEHVLKRYGKDEVESWYFEVWNEPNLSRFFSNTKEDYFYLYEIKVRTIKKIDENHANPKKLWQEMGEPTYVNNEQVKELRAASQLKAESLKIQDGKINLGLMPQSCALITVSNYFE